MLNQYLLFSAAEIPKERFAKDQTKHIIHIKAMLIAYMRDELKYSFEKIAVIIGNNYSSVYKLYVQAESLRKDIPYLAEWYKHLDIRYRARLEYQAKNRYKYRKNKNDDR